MKKIIPLFAIILLSFTAISQQNIVDLPKPEKKGGKPLMEALNERQSSRSFSDKLMPRQNLSDMLWAAFGINRPENSKRTAPTSRNVQDIDIYVVTKEGAYLYLPEKHALQHIVGDDIREFMGKQEFVADAAVNIVYVSDFSKYKGDNDEVKKITASAHCGFIGQNVYLYAASEGLSCVFRAWIDKELIHEKLGLEKNQHVMYSQTVGFPE